MPIQTFIVAMFFTLQRILPRYRTIIITGFTPTTLEEGEARVGGGGEGGGFDTFDPKFNGPSDIFFTGGRNILRL